MKNTITAALLALALSGCASIMNGSEQTIVVNALDPAGNTTCTATNDEGTYRARAGAGMRVRRSSDDLVVRCENRHQVATAVIESSNQWWYYPINAIVWDLCLISCVIDTATGNIFKYPSSTDVMMIYKEENAL